MSCPDYQYGKVYTNIDGKEKYARDCLPPEQCLKEYHYDCKKRLSKNSTVCLVHCCDNTGDCNGGTSRQRNLVADMLPGIRDANEFERSFLRTRCRTTVYYVKFITCYECIPLQLFRSAVCELVTQVEGSTLALTQIWSMNSFDLFLNKIE